MNKLSQLVLGLSGLLLCASLRAEIRIAYVSEEAILKQSSLFTQAQKRLDKEFDKRRAELAALQGRLRDMKNALDKADLTMADNERRQKERDWSNLNGEFQRKSREYSEDMNLRVVEEQKAIRDKALTVIRQIAEAEKYDLVLRDAVYVSNAINITPQVLKVLAQSDKADK